MSQPYAAPITTICSSNTSPNTITINLTPYTAFTPTPNYNLKTYTNGALTNTSSGAYSTVTKQIVVNTDLSYLNVYTFQVQLFNSTDSSEFSIKNENIPVYPVGPTITSRSTITSTTVQVIYDTYSTTGATCIINIPGISYTNLTDTSVTLTGLTAYTPYTSLTILFRKTINGFVVDSSPSAVPSFTTNGIAPVVLSSNASSANNATLIINNYSSATPGQFDFTSAIVVASGATPTIGPITQPNTIYIGSLAPATIYNDCTLTLTASGVSSDPSTSTPFFTIQTLALKPTNLVQVSSTFATITLTFAKPATLPGNIVSIRVFYLTTVEFRNVTLVDQGTVRINSLYSGQTYSDVRIIVSDGTFTSEPSDIVGFISTTSTAPTGISSIAGGNSVTITYTTYSTPADPFIPSSGTLYDSSGNPLGTVSATTTQMVVGGLSPSITYTNSYIILTDGLNKSDKGTVPTFTPLVIPIYTSHYVEDGYEFSSISVDYQEFTAFVPTGVLSSVHYTDSSGNPFTHNGQDPVTQPEYFVIFPGIPASRPGKTYSNCYIILRNADKTSAPSEPRFQFNA